LYSATREATANKPTHRKKEQKESSSHSPQVENANKFGKLSSGHRTGKGQLSFQYQRKAMPKNAQTPTQLHSSHTLVK